MAELAEFRRYIEFDIMELVIQHLDKNEEYIQRMRENVEKIPLLKQNNASIAEFVENDMEFHRLFGKACCNVLIEKVYNFILEYLEKSIAYTHERQDRGARSFESHRLIMDAIDQKDSSIAKAAIDHTVEVWEQLQII